MNRLSSMARGQFRGRHHDSNRRGNTNQPPLTHFLSLPIGHHVSLQQSISSFTSGLLETTPSLPGLDRTVVVPPRRLHLTLGVMSLEEDPSSLTFDSQATDPKKTVAEALALLCSLRSQISDILRGARLSVPLQLMNIMPPDRGDPDKAHVLWIGPSFENEATQRLREVGDGEQDIRRSRVHQGPSPPEVTLHDSEHDLSAPQGKRATPTVLVRVPARVNRCASDSAGRDRPAPTS